MPVLSAEVCGRFKSSLVSCPLHTHTHSQWRTPTWQISCTQTHAYSEHTW